MFLQQVNCIVQSEKTVIPQKVVKNSGDSLCKWIAKTRRVVCTQFVWDSRSLQYQKATVESIQSGNPSIETPLRVIVQTDSGILSVDDPWRAEGSGERGGVHKFQKHNLSQPGSQHHKWSLVQTVCIEKEPLFMYHIFYSYRWGTLKG